MANLAIQPSLIDYIPRARGIERAEACTAKAERRGFDTDAARACILGELERGPQSGEALVSACKAAGIVPHDDRAFGAVFGSLKRRGLIVEHAYCRRAKGHGTAGGIVWGLG